MRVLVTGSSGRLGNAIIKMLKAKGISCVGVDLVKSETTHILADIREKKEITKATRKADHIIHTAAIHGKHLDTNTPRSAFIETNILGTYNMLEASITNGVKTFIYTSSTSVYGSAMENDEKAVWVDENLVPIPRDIYDITKLAAENICKDFFDHEKLNGCTLRVSRFMAEPKNAIANYRLYRGIDERDGAEAHWLALRLKFKSYEVFNISNDTNFRKFDLINLKKKPIKVILKYYPLAKEIYKKNNWVFPSSIDRVYSINKAKEKLNYRPRYNFLEFIWDD